MARSTAAEDCWRLAELGIQDAVELLDGSIEDAALVESTVKRMQAQEIYNLAAQSVSANVSWQHPLETVHTNLYGTMYILESMRKHSSASRLFQASSSEMFGESKNAMQNEETPFSPRNPYATSKLAAHWLVKNYRREHGLAACSGILFNHESPLRGLKYVSRKISDGVARIHLKLEDSIILGNLDATRDWGFAGDYVEAMWRMLQCDNPDDFIIATGKTHTVRDILTAAFAHIGREDWAPYVRQDERYMRTAELPPLCGDSGKAQSILGWQPQVSFEAMVAMMVDADIKRLQR